MLSARAPSNKTGLKAEWVLFEIFGSPLSARPTTLRVAPSKTCKGYRYGMKPVRLLGLGGTPSASLAPPSARGSRQTCREGGAPNGPATTLQGNRTHDPALDLRPLAKMLHRPAWVISCNPWPIDLGDSQGEVYARMACWAGPFLFCAEVRAGREGCTQCWDVVLQAAKRQSTQIIEHPRNNRISTLIGPWVGRVGQYYEVTRSSPILRMFHASCVIHVRLL